MRCEMGVWICERVGCNGVGHMGIYIRAWEWGFDEARVRRYCVFRVGVNLVWTHHWKLKQLKINHRFCSNRNWSDCNIYGLVLYHRLGWSSLREFEFWMDGVLSQFKWRLSVFRVGVTRLWEWWERNSWIVFSGHFVSGYQMEGWVTRTSVLIYHRLSWRCQQLYVWQRSRDSHPEGSSAWVSNCLN